MQTKLGSVLPLFRLLVESLFGQVRRSALKHIRRSFSEEDAVPCQHSFWLHEMLRKKSKFCSLAPSNLLFFSNFFASYYCLLNIFFLIVNSCTWYKIQKVQKGFSDKSPTLISWPSVCLLRHHSHQPLCRFRATSMHVLQTNIHTAKNPTCGDVHLHLIFSLSIFGEWRLTR